MELSKRVQTELVSAMKNKDNLRRGILKLVKAELQNNSLTDKPLSEEDVVFSYHKKLSKNLDSFTGEHLDQLKQELSVIEEFLPKAMTEEEIEALVDKHVSLGNMGAVMKAVKAEITGPFDGKMVSQLVKSKLA
jgi:uncharacterized protein YqeY